MEIYENYVYSNEERITLSTWHELWLFMKECQNVRCTQVPEISYP